MKTFSAKPADIEKKWLLVDAEGVVLGRLASQIALILRGKHKPSYTPHMDCGDNVVVVNAGKVHHHGKKMSDKLHYRHHGYPGGLKPRPADDIPPGHYTRLLAPIHSASSSPHGPLGRRQLKNLRVYAGPEHPHEAQNPEVLDIAGKNPKNKRSA